MENMLTLYQLDLMSYTVILGISRDRKTETCIRIYNVPFNLFDFSDVKENTYFFNAGTMYA